MCCEFCHNGILEELFEIEVIEKVESNFFEEYNKKYENRKNIILKILFNINLISIEEIKKIVQNLNI